MTPSRQSATGTNVALSGAGAHDPRPQPTPESSARRIEVRTLPEVALFASSGLWRELRN